MRLTPGPMRAAWGTLAATLLVTGAALAGCSSSGSDDAGATAKTSTTASSPGGSTTVAEGAEPDAKAPFPCNLVSRAELASLGLIGSGPGQQRESGTGFGDGKGCSWSGQPDAEGGQPPSVSLFVFDKPDINTWIAQSQSGDPEVSRKPVDGLGDLAYGRSGQEVSWVQDKQLIEFQLLPPSDDKQSAILQVAKEIEARL